jgi:hypothetical protein
MKKTPIIKLWGFGNDSIEDYAEDIASRIRVDRYKDAARLFVNFRDVSSESDFIELAKRVKAKGVTDYEMDLVNKQISNYLKGRYKNNRDFRSVRPRYYMKNDW